AWQVSRGHKPDDPPPDQLGLAFLTVQVVQRGAGCRNDRHVSTPGRSTHRSAHLL
ncbi:MAG: hypothetical protein AVDCRST_MAG64-2417, partial [uncultured Phycisphaerae bacterium]